MSPIKPIITTSSPKKNPFFALGTIFDGLKNHIAPAALNATADIIEIYHIANGIFVGSVILRSTLNNLDSIMQTIKTAIQIKRIIPIARLIFIIYFYYFSNFILPKNRLNQ